jgi:uncharacterized membrane protein YgcG
MSHLNNQYTVGPAMTELPQVQVKEQDFGRLYSMPADREKDIRLNVAVWKGSVSLTIFTGQGKPYAVKLGSDMNMVGIIARQLRRAIQLSPDTHERMDINGYDPNEKKAFPEATLIFGRDDKGIVYLGVSGPSFEMKRFPIRLPFKVSLPHMKDFAEQSGFATSILVEDILLKAVPAALIASNEKRDFNKGSQSQGGGNRSGGGGYSQGGQQQGTGGGSGSSPSSAVADEIPY